MKKKVEKEAIMKIIEKMLSNKEDVISYIKGKTSLSTLTKKGIKFGKPL
jgi:hypothetical protein